MYDWKAYADAIASIESAGSGGYRAVGPRTEKGNKAYGRYQVMDFNIPSWTKAHYGQSLTPQQFLYNDAAQDAVFRGEFGSYVNRHGNPYDAASMWFTGRPMSQGGNRKDILGTTGNAYVDKFRNALGHTPTTPRPGLLDMGEPVAPEKPDIYGLMGYAGQAISDSQPEQQMLQVAPMQSAPIEYSQRDPMAAYLNFMKGL